MRATPASYGGALARMRENERGGFVTPEGEHRVLDERRALELLDAHYALQLRCPAGDLRRPGWSFAAAPDPNDPLSLLFGRRALLSLLATNALPEAVDRAGVVASVPELRRAVGALLAEWSPNALFTPYGLRALEAMVATTYPLL